MTSPKSFQEAESIYDRATKLEFAAEFKSAFRLYLEATEAFLRLSRSTVATPAFQAQCREHASKAIQRAEKIKKASKSLGAKLGVVTAHVDAFSADHQACVLRRSSTVNNIRYPLWSEPVSLPLNSGSPYSDPNGQPGITASATITWQRPLRDPFFVSQDPSLALTPADIEQNTIDDCSVCASVAVCVQHNQRFNSRLLSSSLLSGNQLGKYDLRAFLNGDFRRISIDDLLPYDNTGRPVGISAGQSSVTWPALIEKAYMKLMGGYDFPGSNSSIDLRVLTGWIPEHIELQSTLFERERTWERIAKGFQKGCCVLTVGTDTKTTLNIEGVKLLPSHDYAVVDIRETESERWLTLIDSRVPVTSQSLHPGRENGASSSDSRMLNMRWDDICATFEGIYVSWNPGLFQNGTNFHGVWKPANTDDKVQESMRHLRLLYECRDGPGGGPLDTRKDIWVLLSKHFSQTHRGFEYVSLTVHPEDEDDWRDLRVKTGYAEIKAPYTTSPHVLVRTKVGKQYPASSHASSSDAFASAKISGALSVLASYDGPFDDVSFTVNVFCGTDVEVWWDEEAGIGNYVSPKGGGFCTKVESTLTTKNAGGNHTHPTYMLNPQWHLRIHDSNTRSMANRHTSIPGRGLAGSLKQVNGPGRASQKSAVVLSAQGPREVPLNVTVVWSSGERIVELTQKEVVTSSGAYMYGRARAVADMAPGNYTVILSAFEPQVHLGQFTLKVEGSRLFDLAAIPQEGAGMYTRVSKGEWGEHSAVGGPSNGRYHLNPIYEVQLSSSAQLSARLHLTSLAPTTVLNLSLFPASASTFATSTLDRRIASSGPYSDALSGVYIPPRMLSPGKYWLVPSTFAAGVHASFRLVVYCSDSSCVVSRWRSQPSVESCS